MGMVIRNNFNAMEANRISNQADAMNTASVRKLSSGYRITMAADDSAGLAISEKMRAAVQGTNQAIRNANDGISLLSTTDGALGQVGSIVHRVRELAVQAANGTLATKDHLAIGREMTQMVVEIDSIAKNTKFNGITLLDGARSINLMVGADDGDTVSVSLEGFRTGWSNDPSDSNSFLIDQDVDKTNMEEFQDSIDKYWIKTAIEPDEVTQPPASSMSALAMNIISAADTALGRINSERSRNGAATNRLQHVIAQQTVASDTFAKAGSRIRDVDVASETARMTQAKIIANATFSVISQANQSPEMALSLLRHS